MNRMTSFICFFTQLLILLALVCKPANAQITIWESQVRAGFDSIDNYQDVKRLPSSERKRAGIAAYSAQQRAEQLRLNPPQQTSDYIARNAINRQEYIKQRQNELEKRDWKKSIQRSAEREAYYRKREEEQRYIDLEHRRQRIAWESSINSGFDSFNRYYPR